MTKTKSIRTGFCIMKQCEGTKPVSPSGKGLKTCDYWMDCPCECHTNITDMCEMAGVERTLRNVSLYTPDVGRYWMPTPEFMAALRATLKPAVDGTQQGDGPVFNPTPTGIRAKGQLESQVKEVCDKWDHGNGPVNLPLSFIALSIDTNEPPSVGAIREVMLRWEKYGFATMGTKPLAFTGYTATGRERGLDVLKYEFDRDRRIKKAKAERGYR